MPITMLSSLVAGDFAAWTKRLRNNAVLYAVMAILGLTGWALLMVALIAYLIPLFGLMQSGLIVAAALFGIAGLIYAVSRYREHRRRKLAEEDKARTALYASAAALALPTIVRSRPLLLLAVAAGGVVLAGRALANNTQGSGDSGAA